MSSHHVIRDEQEPPLIILDDTFDLAIINQLLGWSPLLIIEAGLLKYFSARQIKVDGIFYLKGQDRLPQSDAEPITSYYFDSEKFQLLQSLGTMLRGKDYTGVNIFCGSEIRDALLEEINFANNLTFPINIFVKDEKTVVAFKEVLKKWYPTGQKLSFNTELVNCEPALKKIGACFKVTEVGSHKFTTNGKFITITEY